MHLSFSSYFCHRSALARRAISQQPFQCAQFVPHLHAKADHNFLIETAADAPNADAQKRQASQILVAHLAQIKLWLALVIKPYKSAEFRKRDRDMIINPASLYLAQSALNRLIRRHTDSALRTIARVFAPMASLLRRQSGFARSAKGVGI
jgi:hypothetical protein